LSRVAGGFKVRDMPEFAFALVDVFADTPLSGNPLAVILDADALPDSTLRGIAREFNQSETTFVLAPREPGATHQLRSFTAAGSEVTGAGHNALGAWWWLAASDRVAPGGIRQELGGDVLDLTIRREHGRLVVAMAQKAPVLGAEVPSRTLAAPLGLDPGQLSDAPARVVSTGAAHLLVAARDSAAVDAARPDAPALQRVLKDASAQGCYLYAPDAAGGAYARFFNPTVGLWEDPATGSAAGPLAWFLTRGAGASTRVAIEQGHAFGRPSRLEVIVDGDHVTLLGSAVLTAEGRLHIHDHQESR
jgi:trans-2,3-dihydro-3-hydroxyanthranilate isomerase